MKNFIYSNIFLSIVMIIISAFILGNSYKNDKEIKYIEVQIEKLTENNQRLNLEIIELKNSMGDHTESINELNNTYGLSIDSENIDKITDGNKLGWFVQYKKFINESDYGLPESIYDFYNDEDITYLQRMVETECYGADFDSKVHVASVALSRAESERFPNTLKEVITQPSQFCYGRTNIDEETILACEYAYMIGSETDGCLWFHSMKKTEKFSGGNYILSDNSHHFYR